MKTEYDANITIKKIFLLIWNRILILFGAMLIGALSGLLVAKISLTDIYTSSSSISSKKSIGPSLQQTICDVAESGEIALKTYENVSQKLSSNILTDITPTSIQEGIKTSFSQNSYVIKIDFSCSNEAACQIVLNSLIEITVEYCSGEKSQFNDLKNSLFISDFASAPIKAADKSFLYTAIGAFVILFASTAFFVGFDLIRDRIFISEDCSSLGFPTLILRNYRTILFVKKKDDDLFFTSKNVVCNSIDVLGKDKCPKIIGLFANEDASVSEETAIDLVSFYAKSQKRTICVDFNLHKESVFSNKTSFSRTKDKGFYFKESDFLSYLYFSKETFLEKHQLQKLFSSLIDEYSKENDYLIFILPPVHLFPDIISIGNNFTCCFGCVKKGVDKRVGLFESIQMIENRNIEINGLIFIDKAK